MLTVALGLAFAPLPGSGQVVFGPAEPVEARVWLDRGDEPIVERGDRLRVYYRSVSDAYVAVFQIDTDGTARLVFPRSPGEDHYVRGGRDYRVVFPGSPHWLVRDDPGVGYFFLVASPEPFDFSALRYSPYGHGWDLGFVGREVYRDPYVAMDDYVAALIPDWEAVPYALDFVSYHVGDRYEYPRFLCYECHGHRGFATWNPYYAACTSFRVVIYDDPYFYPARRYRSDRVVWPRPPAGERPRFSFKERDGREPAGPLVQARAGPVPSVVAPAPRRDPSRGAGEVAAPAFAPASGWDEPVDLGVIRGRPSRPSEPSRSERSTGVAAPPPRSTSPQEAPRSAPERQEADERPDPPPSERPRPTLRKRPSEAAPGGGATTRPAPRREPRAPEPTEAPERPSGGGSASPREGARVREQPSGSVGSSRSGGGGERPVVRRTPDGRPVVRREGR